MTELDRARKAGHIELRPLLDGFAALWCVADTVTVVADGDDFEAIAECAEQWAQSEGIPLRRVMH